MVREIPLTQGKVALVDDDDYESVAVYKWQALRGRHTWYAKRDTSQKDPGGSKCVLLHRQILGVPDGVKVDHRNHDGLDCRRENMRPATSPQNNWNSGPAMHNTSGFKGVYRAHGRWWASLTVFGKQLSFGRYDTREEAARAVDKAARQYHGEFAYQNFPEDA